MTVSPSRFGLPRGIAALRAAMFFLVTASSAPLAHEYWIEPLSYTKQVGETFRANVRNGESFNGASLPFIADQIESADIYTALNDAPLAARLGDLPAVHFEAAEPGWHLVAIQTKPQVNTYDEQGKLEKFIALHDLGGLEKLRQELAGGAIVTENYTRYAKTLFSIVADGQAAVEPSGLLTKSILKVEWVVVTESQFDNGTVVLALLNEGRPVVTRQAEVYHKGNESVTMKKYSTDADGMLRLIDLEPGTYLVNAVIAEVDEKSSTTIATEWASLTFEIQ